MKPTIMQELEGKLHHMEFLTKPVYTQQDINSAISTTAKKCFEEINDTKHSKLYNKKDIELSLSQVAFNHGLEKAKQIIINYFGDGKE